MVVFRLFLLVLWSTALETFHLPNVSHPLPKTDYMKALHQTLQAIDRLMSFFDEEVNEVNLDAIYGLRVLEGALTVSLTQHGDSFWHATRTNKYIHQKLSQLRSQARSVSNRAQASIKKQSKAYYDKFKDVVDKPWSFFKDFGKRKLPMSHVKELRIGEENVTWNEALSDRCMSEVLGSNPNHTECMFTPICVKAMTDQKQTGYGPTHQILFLTFALIHECQRKYSETFKEHLGVDVDGLIENRCVRIMDEMLGIEKQNVPKDARDLYMEQGFVCALHGYEEFFTLKRLENILTWQRTPGCFGNDQNHKAENDEDDDDDDDDDEQWSTFGIEEENDEQMGTHKIHEGQRTRRHVGSFRSMRRLLVDVTVRHGCSAHESGVAAGLLGLYTKWLLTKVGAGSEAHLTALNGDNENTMKRSNRNNKPIPANRSNNDTTSNKKSKPIPVSNHKDISKNNNNINHDISKDYINNNSNNDNVATKYIYIRSMVISFVTSLLTVTVVLVFYKFGGNLCSACISKRKYRPLVDA